MQDRSTVEGGRRQVALIGPVLPFRGGIAQHTTMLARTLRETCDLLLISFSRQYPSWLFPGESDRDPALEGHVEPGADYSIDSLRPWTWARAVRRLRADRVKTLIIPWWTVFWAPCYGYIARAAGRADIEVVLLCHNVLDHEAAGWKTVMTRRVLALGDRFITHTRADADRLTEILGNPRVDTYPHPVNEDLPEPTDALPRRAPTELLFFGFIRPYKGLQVLLDAMPLLAAEDVFLSVVGESWEDLTPIHDQVREDGQSERIEFVSRYVSDNEVADYFARADVVVLPYRSATGSGVVPVAYRYRKPVIATSVGGLPDVVRHGTTGYLVPPDSPEAVAGAIRDFIAHQDSDWTAAIDAMVAELSWERFAAVVLGSRSS